MVRCSECLDPWVDTEFKADGNDWLKGVAVFGERNKGRVKNVAEFAGVWKRLVIRVYQQWLNPSLP